MRRFLVFIEMIIGIIPDDYASKIKEGFENSFVEYERETDKKAIMPYYAPDKLEEVTESLSDSFFIGNSNPEGEIVEVRKADLFDPKHLRS